jgi:hypothetical protein
MKPGEEKEEKLHDDKDPGISDKGAESGAEASDGDKPDKGFEEVDGDKIIDLFLDENPDLAELPVEEWPEEALEVLTDAFNTGGVDAANGEVEESGAEEPGLGLGEPEPEEGGAPPFPEDLGEREEDPGPPPPAVEPEAAAEEEAEEADYDFETLERLVKSGDKDAAWEELQSLFGAAPEGDSAPTNALSREADSAGLTGNPLAKLLAGLKF